MDFQQAIALILVAVAALFLGRYLWKSVSVNGEDACSGCGGCGKPMPKPAGVRTPPQTTPLIGLSVPPRRKNHDNTPGHENIAKPSV
jgi:hypothetical protein